MQRKLKRIATIKLGKMKILQNFSNKNIQDKATKIMIVNAQN